MKPFLFIRHLTGLAYCVQEWIGSYGLLLLTKQKVSYDCHVSTLKTARFHMDDTTHVLHYAGPSVGVRCRSALSRSQLGLGVRRKLVKVIICIASPAAAAAHLDAK